MSKKYRPNKPYKQPEQQSNLPINIPVKKEEDKSYVPETLNTNYPLLSDICGPSNLKESLEDVVFNIVHADLYGMMCAKPDKSYLLTGYPATGKTMAMAAIRNELVKKGLQVIEIPYDIGRHGTAYINMGAVNLQKVFDMADKYAVQGYAVLMLFDEADSIMSKRGNRMSSHKEDDKLLNCLMKNQQRINDNTLPIFMFYATNFPESLDEASIRSGRVDKIIRFPMPDLDAITQGYRTKIGSKNKEFKEMYGKELLIKNVDYKSLTKASEGFNYADLDNVIHKALKQRVKDIMLAPQDKIAKMGYVNGQHLIRQVEILQRDKKGTKYRKIGFGGD